MSRPTTAEVADALEEIGLLLELLGENPFKTRAYGNAARIVRGLDVSLEELIERKALGGIKGIGPALVDKITTLVTTGTLPYLDELRKQLPAGMLEWLKIPGLGPKKARVIHVTLGIATLAELETAAREGKLRDLPGFGEATEKKILSGIARVREHMAGLRRHPQRQREMQHQRAHKNYAPHRPRSAAGQPADQSRAAGKRNEQPEIKLLLLCRTREPDDGIGVEQMTARAVADGGIAARQMFVDFFPP